VRTVLFVAATAGRQSIAPGCFGEVRPMDVVRRGGTAKSSSETFLSADLSSANLSFGKFAG